MSREPEPSDVEFWERKPRHVERITIKRVDDRGDAIEILTTASTGFIRSKKDLGRDINVGDSFDLETVNFSHITGMRDLHDVWLFHLSNDDLAAEHRRFLQESRRRRVVQLEENKTIWAEWERNLPDWLQARIKRFRAAAGEQFLLEGWGYELVICRLAEAYAAGDEARANELGSELGSSGNQHGCAKLLADLHDEGRDNDLAYVVPAGLSPLTGSADYS